MIYGCGCIGTVGCFVFGFHLTCRTFHASKVSRARGGGFGFLACGLGFTLPGPQKFVTQWPLWLSFWVWGYYITYFWDLGKP